MKNIYAFVPKSIPSSFGFSLIEMMVALAIGSVLMLGLVEIFGSVRNTFATASASSRMQETGRGVLDLLRRDVRMTGHFGCLNEQAHFNPDVPRFENHLLDATDTWADLPHALRFDRPLEVYDYKNTGWGDEVQSDTIHDPFNVEHWTPNLPAPMNVWQPDPGSDVLVVRYGQDSVWSLTPGPTPAESGANPVSGLVRLTNANTLLQINSMYGMTNCKNASLLQVVSTSSDGFGIAGGLNFQRSPGAWFAAQENYGVGSLVFPMEAAVFYKKDGQLVMRRLSADDWGDAVLLIPRVDDFQLALGVDTTAPLDGAADRYRDATEFLTGQTDDQVTTLLRSVTSVRLALWLSSPDLVSGFSTGGDRDWFGAGIRRNQNNDGRMRAVFDTTIALRNRIRG